MPSIDLIKAVAVTAELCGRTFSEAAARVFVDDLSAYPEPQVLGALRRCRKEVHGILTVQDVVSRLDDGRPGPEEAWAAMPLSQSASVVWTDEMAEAFGVALQLLDAGDKVAARMAFKESYAARVAAAREAGKPINWTPTLGHDKAGADAVLADAVSRGRIPLAYAREFRPELIAQEAAVIAIAGAAVRAIGSSE
jgi:hypothetical protein